MFLSLLKVHICSSFPILAINTCTHGNLFYLYEEVEYFLFNIIPLTISISHLIIKMFSVVFKAFSFIYFFSLEYPELSILIHHQKNNKFKKKFFFYRNCMEHFKKLIIYRSIYILATIP